MQKIIPFKKEILFKNTIKEILSMSMDNHLELEKLEIKGNFIVSGEYEGRNGKEPFNFDIPYIGYIDEIYDTKEAKIDIDDFYYEVNEPNKLSIFIDISVDNLSELPLIELENIEELSEVNRENNEDLTENNDFIDNIVEEQEDIEEIIEREENMSKVEEIEKNDKHVLEVIEEEREGDISTAMFNNFNDNNDEGYQTYKIYIFREGDTIESVLEKYEISYDQLIKYNIVNELSVGDKLIIPYEKNK